MPTDRAAAGDHARQRLLPVRQGCRPPPGSGTPGCRTHTRTIPARTPPRAIAPMRFAQLDRRVHRARLVDQQRRRPRDPALGLDLYVGHVLEPCGGRLPTVSPPSGPRPVFNALTRVHVLASSSLPSIRNFKRRVVERAAPLPATPRLLINSLTAHALRSGPASTTRRHLLDDGHGHAVRHGVACGSRRPARRRWRRSPASSEQTNANRPAGPSRTGPSAPARPA